MKLLRWILAAVLFSNALITGQAEANSSLIYEDARDRMEQLDIRRDSQIDTMIHFVRKGYCDHIYWDIGSNISIQIRKLYEPHYFNRSPVLPYFHTWFGAPEHRKRVCSLGVEANDEHTPRLLDLQSAYQNASYPCVVLTDTAASNREGNVTFYHDIAWGAYYKQLGASITPYDKEHNMSTRGVTQSTLDLDRLVLVIMGEWKSRNFAEGTSRMISKMDIEGSEYLVLPHMAEHGSLCYFDIIMLEWHAHMQPADSISKEAVLASIQEAVRVNVGCKITISEVDDEWYAFDDKRPFPQPGIRISIHRT
jgi:hypothetical protein